jgi:glycosyltransferase involved in cell wall biosynthesis
LSGPKIVYLLEDTALYGGVKVVLEQANLLAARGWDVTVVSPGEKPDWLEMQAKFERSDGLEPEHIPPADLLVATFWTTLAKVRAARERSGGEILHFCQGFEGSNTHNVHDHPAIEAAYSEEIPAIAVAPHLAKLIEERFRRPARVVPQPLGEGFTPKMRFRPRRKPRVLVVGPYEFYLKGVPTALEAIVKLRRRGIEARAIRLSQWPLSPAEQEKLVPDEFHQLLPPSEVPDLMRSCDLLLAPSWPQEGFGLPALEAMGCGLPVVASDIPAYREFASPAAILVPYEDPEAFAMAAESLLKNPASWREHRRQGLEIAKNYAPELCAAALEGAIQWVLGGGWRRELEALRRSD